MKSCLCFDWGRVGYALCHIANHRTMNLCRSSLEDDDNKIKKNTGNSKTCKKLKNIGHSVRVSL
jgi:hypothetical protein